MSRKSASLPLLENLRHRLRQHMNNKADDVATGSCQNFPDYKFQTGIIEGLAWAERELLDLDEELEAADE